MSETGKNGLTYSDAGVDIDAGNLMVEKIKPAVRSTRRPGADGEIGGRLDGPALDDVFDLDATVRHVDTVFERLRALVGKEQPVHV